MQRVLCSFALYLVLVAGATLAAPADWQTTRPGDVGLDAAALELLATDIRAQKYPNIHALLVVRHGKLAFEEYFEGQDEKRGTPVGLVRFDADTLHDARSVTKTVVSILCGLAVQQGAVAGVDKPVLDFFPELKDLRTPERFAIRVSHVLSMTSGLKWDEGSRPYGDPLNSETAMDAASDRYRYVLQQPVVAKPGTQFEYSGGDTMLLAGVIERATGMPLKTFAEKALFGPLGIRKHEWLKYPNGTAIAASGLRLLPRDMAKIGQVFLSAGKWGNAQIVPESWVEASLAPHATIADRPFGFQRYGYQWWLGTARVGEAGVPWAAAVGWGGQRILVVPSMDTVVVLTAGLYGDRRQTDITFEIMLDRVLPAVRN